VKIFWQSILIVLLLLFPGIISAAIIHVPGDQPTIQAGIDDADNGDIVMVADDTYTGTGNRDIDFKRKAITVRSENGPENCIIDCENSGRGFYIHDNESENSILQGFTIKNGSENLGGAIWCHNAFPIINNNILIQNSATTGGAIRLDISDAGIIGNTFIENEATQDGGGIFIDHGSDGTVVKDNIFSQNQAGANGGGICCSHDADPIISSNTIEDNSADTGGGIYCYYNADPTISNNTIHSNEAQHGGGIHCENSSYPIIVKNVISENLANISGGGIRCQGQNASPTIMSCTIIENVANVQGGAGIWCHDKASPKIVNNFILGNTSYDDGGGILVVDDSNPMICNNVIANNSAMEKGAGIYCYNCKIDTVNLINNTIYGNTADPNGKGGGIYCHMSNQVITNTILWNNSASTGKEIYIGSTSETSNLTIDYSDLEGGQSSVFVDSGCNLDWGSSMIDLDPLFVNSSNGDFHLQHLATGHGSDSPCVDIGSDLAENVCLETFSGTTCMSRLSTRIDNAWDTNQVDMGFHYTAVDQIIVYVDDDAPNDPGPGDPTSSDEDEDGSAAHPFDAIQEGIDTALNGMTVLVADGTYTGIGNINLNFDGEAITLMSENGAVSTVIDCQDNGRGFDFDSGEQSTSVLQGFTIQNGNTGDDGGAISCIISHPTITDCIITSNISGDGGGIYCFNASPLIKNCVISGNDADYGGAGDESPSGGGIYCENHSSPEIIGCTISANTANYDGGGICCRTVSSPLIYDCVIFDNEADDDGGGISSWESIPVITGCIISNNTASSVGGGIEFFVMSEPILKNCIISENHGGQNAGGIVCWNSNPTITNCTFTLNTTSGFQKPGGILYGADGAPTIINCILWEDDLPEIAGSGSGIPNITYSDIQDDHAYTGEGNIYVDPLFVSGPLGSCYLSQVDAGQTLDSPCVGAGSGLAASICFQIEDGTVCMNQLTTRTDHVADSGQVDMGFHYGNITPAIIKNVRASQRLDASKWVDISFTLEGEEGAYQIGADISDNGGVSWDFTPVGIWGEIGAGITPGTDKHIIWDPAQDLPGVSGSNFRIRLETNSIFYAYSNIFEINASGPGALIGTVLDNATGVPIEGANVVIQGQDPTLTDEYGQFSFSNFPAGLFTLHVDALGYYDLDQIENIREDSRRSLLIPMCPIISFGAVEVHAAFCGPGRHVYYLDGVDLVETFEAAIEWGDHTPYAVRWKTPYGVFTDPWTGNPMTRSFNMGSDFGEGGTLTVEALSTTHTSPGYTVNFDVIPSPPGMLNSLISADLGSETLKYTSTTLNDAISMIEEGVDEGTIPDDIPLFGREAFMFISMFDFASEIQCDGSATGLSFNPELPEGQGKTKLAGFNFKPNINGRLTWRFDKIQNQWLPGGDLKLGATLGADVPPTPIVFFFGPVPCYFRGHIDIGFLAGLELQGWSGPGESIWNGSLELDPFPYAEANLGAGIADVAAVEGYLGGKAKIDLQYPTTPHLKTIQIVLSGGVRIVFWLFTYEWPVLEYPWDFYSGLRGSADPGPPVIGILSRDYLDRGEYAVFVANEDRRSDTISRLTEEMPIQLNIYDQSQADLAAMGDDLLLVWLHDDPSRTDINRTVVVFSRYDSATQTWSTPAPAGNGGTGDILPEVESGDDGTPDFHPEVASLPNGDVLMAWENVRERLNGLKPAATTDQIMAKLLEMKSNMEIAVSRYDSTTGIWEEQAMITNNHHLDHSPRLATADDGTAMLTWVSNVANKEFGSSAEPNKIYYSFYNGAIWSDAAVVATGVPPMIKTALAYNGTEAILLFIQDMDEITQTPEDRELYSVVFSGGSWGFLNRLTDDTVEDTNPQVAYDANEDPLITWYSNGNIEMSTDPVEIIDRAMIVEMKSSASMGVADFRLATGDGGQIALIWQEASEDRVDMWRTTYDAVVDAWSKPLRLTGDESDDNYMEYGMTSVFDVGGDLIVAYDRAHTVYETRTVTVGDDEVEVEVPMPGQVDLLVHDSWHEF